MKALSYYGNSSTLVLDGEEIEFDSAEDANKVGDYITRLHRWIKARQMGDERAACERQKWRTPEDPDDL